MVNPSFSSSNNSFNSEKSIFIGNPLKLSNDLNSEYAFSPSLVYNTIDKEYLVVWDFADDDSRNIALQRFSPTGSLIGESIILPEEAGVATEAAIAHNSTDNEYLVSFRVQNDPSFPSNSSVGQRITADGQLIEGNFAIANGGFENSLVYNYKVKEYFQTSRLFAPDSDSNGIFGQRVSADGTLDNHSIDLDTDSPPDGNASSGQVTFNSIDNQYLVTWRKQDDPNSAVEGLLIGSDGTPIGEQFEIGGESALTYSITTAFDPINTQFLVAYGIPDEGEVRAQLVDADGSLIGDEMVVLEDGFNRSLGDTVSVAYSENLQTYLVVGVTDSGLLGRFITASGETIEDPFVISSSDKIANTSVVYNEDVQEFVVAWDVFFGFEEGIYAQRIDPPNLVNTVTMYGTAGQDVLMGTLGNDIINGGDGKDRLFGNKGNDFVNGGKKQDYLFGESGNDTLVGGRGADFLDGGAGEDDLLGGKGLDKFILRIGEGTDTILDYEDNIDSFVLGGGLEFNDLSISQSFDGTKIQVTETQEVLGLLVGVRVNQVDRTDFSTMAT